MEFHSPPVSLKLCRPSVLGQSGAGIYTVRLKEFENSLSQIGTESGGKSKKTARKKVKSYEKEKEKGKKKKRDFFLVNIRTFAFFFLPNLSNVYYSLFWITFISI